jgi:hypothetical protein
MTELIANLASTTERGQISLKQYETLMKPLNGTRVAKRSQGGKQLSYLEAWDVKAHLTRVFGFGNWDLETLDSRFIAQREYLSRKPNNAPDSWTPSEMVEVIWSAKMQLTIRDEFGRTICVHSETAVGNASGPVNMLGEHHDNAVKQAASDALKRCAINLGSQFGLSLYDDGSLREVIKGTIVVPEGYEKPQPSAEQAAALARSVGAGGDSSPVPDPEAADHAAAQEAAAEGLGATPVDEGAYPQQADEGAPVQ